MSSSVPKQCLQTRKDAPPILKPPSSWLARLSAEQTAIVPKNGVVIPSILIP